MRSSNKQELGIINILTLCVHGVCLTKRLNENDWRGILKEIKILEFVPLSFWDTYLIFMIEHIKQREFREGVTMLTFCRLC